MNVVKGNNACEVVPDAVEDRRILVCEESGIAAFLVFLGRAHGVALQTLHLVALAFVVFGKFCHIISDRGGVCVGILADSDSGVVFFLGDLAVDQLLLQPVGVGHVVQIAILLPLLVLIDHLVIGFLF